MVPHSPLLPPCSPITTTSTTRRKLTSATTPASSSSSRQHQLSSPRPRLDAGIRAPKPAAVESFKECSAPARTRCSRDLQRFLAESIAGNESTNSTICDEVCQLKSSLIEEILARATNLKIAEFPILGHIRNSRVRVKDTTFSSRWYGTRESKEVTVEGRVQFDLLQLLSILFCFNYLVLRHTEFIA
ncbi:hypothetical protein JHK84_043022 [Glycine max]|nr:hypothetical protein JHK84_043022 [Glycine max]